MAENNSVCSICGKEYYACLSCHDSIKNNPWKVFTDTSEHYKVYQIIRGYNTGIYTKDDAKYKLKNVNLDDIESFRPHIKQIVEDIIKENKSVEAERATVEMIVEKPVVSRKKNYRPKTK
jgi:uncharacterized CHY-type Zn-finger protein